MSHHLYISMINGTNKSKKAASKLGKTGISFVEIHYGAVHLLNLLFFLSVYLMEAVHSVQFVQSDRS